MLTFRPHALQTSTATEGTVDTNGDYIEGTRTWGNMYPCLAVPSGKAQVIVHDGKQYAYNYVVHLNADAPTLTFGDKVKLYQGDTPLGEFDVLGFHRYQLSCLAWL